MTPFLLKALSGESVGRFPVWMMRQAGRYLPSYRAIREKHSFWEMVSTPDIAAEVSLLPLSVLDLDAVIFFSDILTLPYGMGLEIGMKEAIGPVVANPMRDKKAFEFFNTFDAPIHTEFVGKTLNQIRERLPEGKALLGFAGAPWTVACYLVEGSGKKGFGTIRRWAYEDPESLAEALRILSKVTGQYLKYQLQSGAHAVQVFDTWIAEMPRDFFSKYYLPILNGIFSEIHSEKSPAIYFSKNSLHVLDFFKQLSADVLSVDSSLDLKMFEMRTGSKFSLQGNLDPYALLGSEGLVRRLTRELVQTARTLQRPAILNLGHGIFPNTPVENAKAFVDEARTLWV